MRRLSVRCVWLCLALTACSGDDPAGTTPIPTTPTTTGDDDDDFVITTDFVTCDEPFVACGGDPIGEWTVDEICEVPIDQLDCAGAVLTITTDRSSGTVSVREDNSYDRLYVVDVDFNVTIPSSCLGPLTCPLLVSYSGGILTACTDLPDGCDCDGTIAETDSSTGTWTLDAGNVLVTDANDRTEFCINRDQATTLDEDGTRASWLR